MRKLTKEILINHTSYETRVAVLEGGRVVEFYLERPHDKGLTGNIFKGKVVRVLPGMQAAFVDIGLDRTAFLHVTDIHRNFKDGAEIMTKESNIEQAAQRTKIQDILKTGQDIMVQVEKEPIGAKGARITSQISLPGRLLVIMPFFNHIGISRRIESEKERRRLYGIVDQLKTDNYGFIIRTASEGMDMQEIKADMNFLTTLWKNIKKRYEEAENPSLIYSELELSLRTARDLFVQDVSRIYIDSKEKYEDIISFIEKFPSKLVDRVEYYDGIEPIFDIYGVEVELNEALSKKVWLKSGGFIIIDQMEALTGIDVNTGKYIGKISSEDTILRTNLEAVKEIVYQLRLRNIGGIVIIDFIDMEKASSRAKVFNSLREAIKIDRARTNILEISELGIVEMTRERVRANMLQQLCEPCPYCEGNGHVKGKETVVMEIYRELLKELPVRERRKISIHVNSTIADFICCNETIINDLEKRFGKKIIIKVVDSFHQEHYEIV